MLAGSTSAAQSIPALRVVDVRQRFAALVGLDQQCRVSRTFLAIGDRGAMRRDDDARVGPQRGVFGQRLLFDDVEHGLLQSAAVQRIDDVLRHHVRSAAGVDQAGAAGQLR
ncbi:hypothetical protein G6F55_014271 [Rhizopus delemar]|nr:hypothetical protein G6F55_014271 [Rhizopus delemar]